MDANERKENEDLYQIALLIDQLKHDDVSLRINASNSLEKIAIAIGSERTKDELIPFLTNSIDDDDDDDVLIIIAKKLGELTNYIGGDEYVYKLIQPLELLSNVEDSTVRDAVIRSLEMIVSKMPNEHLVKYYVPFIVRLGTQKCFTSRTTAAALFHFSYNRLPENEKKNCRSLFLRLCVDETPMVKRVAAQYLGLVAEKVKPDHIHEFMSAFILLAKDDQDSVRIQVISTCIVFCNILSQENKLSQILPIVLNIANDKSWRVRWSLANKLHEVCKALGDQVTNNSLAKIYEDLLTDQEAEVRAAAASHISNICSLLRKETILSHVIPGVQSIVSDSSEFVRSSLAGIVNDLASMLGREETVEHLLPILLRLLRDEISEVRLNVISNLEIINKVVGVELLSQSLLPAIVELAEDSKWRVRLVIIEHMPMLAGQLGSAFFNEKLNSLCMNWLGDNVYSVRRAAAENLQKLSELFGEEWACENIIPAIERVRKHTNYLQRMTALYAIQQLAKSFTRKSVESILTPMTIEMTNDPVANIRFTVAKTLKLLIQCVGRSSKSVTEMEQALNELVNDSDKDVQFFAR